MKNRLIRLAFIMAVVLPAIGNCGIVSIVTSRHIDWSFIQAVGGISVGTPAFVESKEWYIPIDCDVSGSRRITIEPSTINSALVVRKIKSKVQKGTIFIWVITSVGDKQNNSSSSTGITLRNIPDGSYNFLYLNPDGTTVPIKTVPIKTVQLEKTLDRFQ